MDTIHHFKAPDGIVYEFEDQQARQDIAGIDEFEAMDNFEINVVINQIFA